MAKDDTSQQLITLAEASRRYGLSPTYLRTIARAGRLTAQKVGRDWLTTSADVEAYIRTRSKRGVFRDEALVLLNTEALLKKVSSNCHCKPPGV